MKNILTNKVSNKQRKFIGLFLAGFFVFVSCKPKNEETTIEPVQANSSKDTASVRISATLNIPKAPSKLCIYYSWPSVVNGAGGNVTNAVNTFSQFDVIVFGDGIWKSSHGDNTKTKQIIAALVAKGKKVYGYIDVGVKTQNQSEAQLKAAIDGWKAMGATGVFGDDFGTDYGVYRARQNVFIDYAHSKGMSVFANCWSVNDALGGSDCHLDKRDFYLLESFGYGHGIYRPLGETMDDRAKVAYYYMKMREVSIATIATTTPEGLSANANTTQPFLHSYYATIAWNFDAFGFTDMNYSGSGPNGNKVSNFTFPLISYGKSFVQIDYVSKVNSTLYLRGTDTHNLYISDKTGYFIKK